MSDAPPLKGCTIYDLHGRLIRDTFSKRLNDSDSFLVFVLFHLYRVVLSGTWLTDAPGVRTVEALTQRSVGEALASAWRGKDEARATYLHWYYRWNDEWGSYGHAENLTPEETRRFTELKAALERHPFVERFEEED